MSLKERITKQREVRKIGSKGKIEGKEKWKEKERGRGREKKVKGGKWKEREGWENKRERGNRRERERERGREEEERGRKGGEGMMQQCLGEGRKEGEEGREVEGREVGRE